MLIIQKHITKERETMAKRKNKNRNKVNFSNPKVRKIVSYLELGENRITKQEILNLGNKDVFYQLKNSGYIQQSSKGEFKGTSKLHSYIKKTDGRHFSSSGSSSHAKSVRDSLSFLPSSVLERKSYSSSADAERYFEKKVKPTQQYKEELYRMKQELKEEMQQIESVYASSQTEQQTDFEHFSSRMDYLHNKELVTSRIEWLEDRTYLIPDYQVTLRQDELSQYIETLSDYRDTLDTESKAYSLYTESIEKLQVLSSEVEGDITISIEVITDSYGQRELQLHKNFERLSAVPQIYLM